MTYEYECEECGFLFSLFFKTFSSAKPHEDESPCPRCGSGHGVRVISMPLQAHLYGDPAGYHKPSPTKRFNTKTVSQKEGNASAIG